MNQKTVIFVQIELHFEYLKYVLLMNFVYGHLNKKMYYNNCL